MINKAEWWTAIECRNILLTATTSTIFLFQQYLLNAQCDNHSDGRFVDYHWPDLRFRISAERLNRTASAWVGTSLLKPLIAGDTTDFHFAEYLFLLWMPFKKLWDMYSNYFFTLTTMQKDSDRQFQARQNASSHPAQHQDAVLNSSMLRKRLWKRCHCLLRNQLL